MPKTEDSDGGYATAGQNGGVIEGVSYIDMLSDEWLSANLHKMDRRDMIYTILALRTHAVKTLRTLEDFCKTEMLYPDKEYGEMDRTEEE